MFISIIICTYNRADILEKCLASLLTQTTASSEFEVLVIDNNSKDHTAEVAKAYAPKFENYKLIKELNQGLSYARNTGFKVALTDWIVYLDDDAKARPTFVENIIKIAKENTFSSFGGIDIPYYPELKPYWFKDKYIQSRLPYDKTTQIKKHEFITGFAMIIHKRLFKKYGSFSVNLGMNGNKIAYGEETEFQVRLHANNEPIGYVPSIVVDHLAPEYKLNIDWFFKSYFALGRDQIEMGIAKTNPFSLLLTAIILIGMITLHLLYYTPKLLSKNYYIQNWLIDVFKKPTKRIAILYTALLYRSNNKHNK